MIDKTTVIIDPKNLTKELPTVRFTDPDFVYLPITNTRCSTGEVFIKKGDKVKVGQVIGMRKASFFEQPIHSTASGEFIKTEKKFHRGGKFLECLVIKNDKKNDFADSVKERTDKEIKKLKQKDYVEITKNNGLVGLGGSGFPTYIKLMTKENIHTIMINAIECEPYLTTDYRLVMEYPHRIIKGTIYSMNAVNAKKGLLIIKEKYSELEDVLNEALVDYPDYDIEVCKVGNYFPQGWEIEMFKSATGTIVPQGVLPAKFGILNFNVATIVGLYKAVKYNMPVVKRNFTITGDGIVKPQNFRIRVGTPVKDLIAACGGYTDDKDKVIILGGPMMGMNFVRDDIVTSKTSTSLIVLNKEEYFEEPCVRCASCVYSCPVGLKPVMIMNLVKTKNKEALSKMPLNKCIECGLCSYTCTSKIHLTEYMRKAKRMVR